MVDNLTIRHARIRGSARREALEAALCRVEEGLPDMGSGHLLFIPRVRSERRLRGKTGSFGKGLAAQLKRLAEQATRDPKSASPDQPLLFTSHAAFIAWLTGTVLTENSASARALVKWTTGEESPARWWRRDVVPHGRVVVALVQRLAETVQAAEWVARLDPLDVDTALASVARDYQLDRADWDGWRPEQLHPSPSGVEGPVPRTGPRGSTGLGWGLSGASLLPTQRDLTGPTPNPSPKGEGDAARQVQMAQDDLQLPNQQPSTVNFAAIAQPILTPGLITLVAKALHTPINLPQNARVLIASSLVLANQPAMPRRAFRSALARLLDPARAMALDTPAYISAQANSAPSRDPTSPPIADHQEPAKGPAIASQPSEKVDPIAERDAPSPATQADPAPPAFDAPVPRQTVSTEYGGLFFLINAFTSMGLYGDFTRPMDGLKGLSPFELLLLLGRHWFGRRFLADPLSPFLLSCAGHANVRAVGRDFDPPSWRVPPAWRTPWPEARLRTRRTSSRTSMWHQAGFVARERWIASPASAVVRKRWISNLARYLEARTAMALRQPAPVTTLCQRPALITCTEDRLTIGLDLARHPLAIRFAGLDHDIGWLPAAGFDIRFDFA